MYLTRGGYVTLTTGSLQSGGGSGGAWFGAADASRVYAYSLYFDIGVIKVEAENVKRGGWIGCRSPRVSVDPGISQSADSESSIPATS